MPHIYLDKGTYNVIPRVSEIIGTLNCELKASNHPVHTGSKRWKSVSSYVALKGTMLHHQIENYLRELIDLPMTPLDITPSDQNLLYEIMQSNEDTEWLYGEIDKGWDNFLKFWEDFSPEIVKIEHTMVYVHRENGVVDTKRSMKGTVDLICTVDPEKMSPAALKILPIEEKSTLVLDWKSGVAKLLTHHAQLEAYSWLLRETGDWDSMIDKGMIRHPFASIRSSSGRKYPVAMCVLLGGSKYKAHVYDLTEGHFEEARSIFLNPSPIVLSRTSPMSTSFNREGYYCVFCEYRDSDCKIFKVTEGGID